METTQEKDNKKCCLCGKNFIGWGNNPYPLKRDGLCCNKCNNEKVIPTRLELYFMAKAQK